MNIRLIFLTILFLLPVEFWTCVVTHYKPFLELTLPMILSIGVASVFVVFTFVLATNLLISCILNLFKNIGLNFFFIVLAIACVSGTAYMFSKVKMLNKLLQKFLPKKSLTSFTSGFKKVIGNVLLVTACIVLVSRILFTVLTYIVFAKEDKLLRPVNS